MGEIVGGYGTSHVLFPSDGVEEQAATVVGGFDEIGRRIRGADVDLVVLVSSEHGPTMPPLGPQPPFAIGVGEHFDTFGDMDIPKVRIPASSDYARGFVQCVADEFDVAVVDVYRADHGTAIPALMMFPDCATPIVPLILNAVVPEATASPARCYRLGERLGAYARSRPERIAIVGCGGLSHWPGTPEMGRVEAEFDRRFLQMLSHGRASEAAQWSVPYILEHGGNGGLEIRNWMLVAGAVGDTGGETLYYEPMPQWYTGMSAFAFA